MNPSPARPQPRTIVLALLWAAIAILAAAGGPADAQEAESPFDPAPLNRVLEAHVDEQGLVDYEALKDDREDLDAFLSAAADVERSEWKEWPKEDRIAFLLNVYNASALALVIDHHPVDSIKDIGSFVRGVFDIEFIDLFGDTVSLDHVEHGILRKEFRESRIHFALVCAARSCPRLRREAYVGARLDDQLRDQTRTFLATESKNDFRVETRGVFSKEEVLVMELSPIFKWFEEDFEKTHGGVADFVKLYLSPDRREYVNEGDWDIDWRDYDWSLNEQD